MTPMRARIGQEFRIGLSEHQPRFPLLEKLHRVDQGAVDPPQKRAPDKAPREHQFQWRRGHCHVKRFYCPLLTSEVKPDSIKSNG